MFRNDDNIEQFINLLFQHTWTLGLHTHHLLKSWWWDVDMCWNTGLMNHRLLTSLWNIVCVNLIWLLGTNAGTTGCLARPAQTSIQFWKLDCPNCVGRNDMQPLAGQSISAQCPSVPIYSSCQYCFMCIMGIRHLTGFKGGLVRIITYKWPHRIKEILASLKRITFKEEDPDTSKTSTTWYT